MGHCENCQTPLVRPPARYCHRCGHHAGAGARAGGAGKIVEALEVPPKGAKARAGSGAASSDEPSQPRAGRDRAPVGGYGRRAARAPPAAADDSPLALWDAQKRAERKGYAAGAAFAAAVLAFAHVAVAPAAILPFARWDGATQITLVRPTTAGAWLSEAAGTTLMLVFCAALARGVPDGVEGACLTAAGPCRAPRWFWFRYACAKGLLISLLYVTGAICLGVGRW